MAIQSFGYTVIRRYGLFGGTVSLWRYSHSAVRSIGTVSLCGTAGGRAIQSSRRYPMVVRYLKGYCRVQGYVVGGMASYSRGNGGFGGTATACIIRNTVDSGIRLLGVRWYSREQRYTNRDTYILIGLAYGSPACMTTYKGPEGSVERAVWYWKRNAREHSGRGTIEIER